MARFGLSWLVEVLEERYGKAGAIIADFCIMACVLILFFICVGIAAWIISFIYNIVPAESAPDIFWSVVRLSISLVVMSFLFAFFFRRFNRGVARVEIRLEESRKRTEELREQSRNQTELYRKYRRELRVANVRQDSIEAKIREWDHKLNKAMPESIEEVQRSSSTADESSSSSATLTPREPSQTCHGREADV